MILLIEWIFEVLIKKKKSFLKFFISLLLSISWTESKLPRKGEKIIAAKKVTPLPAQASLKTTSWPRFLLSVYWTGNALASCFLNPIFLLPWFSSRKWSRNLQVNHCLGVTQGPSQGCWGVSSGFDGIVLSKQTGLIFRSLHVAVKHVFSVLSPFPCRATAAACPWDPFPWKHVILYWSIFSLGQQKRGQNSGLTHSFVQDPLSEALSDPPLDVYKQHNL